MSDDSEASWLELRAAGVIEQDAPDPFEYQRRMAALSVEFTPAERAEIRVRLSMRAPGKEAT